jgi:hypothetical protein
MLKSQAGGGAAGGATGTPGASESLGPAVRELQGADPEYAMKLVNSMKKDIVNNLIPMLAFRAPAASRAIASVLKGLDTAINELQKAQATMNAVGGGIKNSAIPQPQPPTGGLGAPNVTQGAGTGM